MTLDIHTIDEPAPQSSAHQVTDIREAVKNQQRVNIFIDCKFFCSLEISQVVDLHIKVGRTLNDEELAQLKRASDFGKFYARALEYVFARPHSTKEIRDYLKRKTLSKIVRVKNPKTGEYTTKTREGYDASLVEPVMRRLDERGYLDDEKFARAWIENRNLKKGISRKKLQLELAQKGVSSEIIDRLFSESARDEREELRKMIARKSRRYDDEQKLIQYLLRQGFNYSDISEELSSFSDDSSWSA